METQNLSPTPASDWKGKPDLAGTDLLLPSENVARVKQMSPQAFITSGLIPDPLSKIIRESIHNKRGLPPSALKKISDDPDMLVSAMEMFDTVTAWVVVAPVVKMPPACASMIAVGNSGEFEPCGEYANTDVHKTPMKSGHHQYMEGDRDPNVLYADMVDMEDKMFIFQWCLGGTRDLQKFRDEQQSVVESLSDGQGVQRPAKRAARRT